VWKCADCRKQFSVLTGTIFHGSKIPVRTWLFVVVEMCASKNGVSAREIQRKYDLTPKSAWFMAHRIREAMKRDPLAGLLAGTIVADEAYIGGTARRKRGTLNASDETEVPRKSIVLTLVHRESGEARSRVIPNVKGDTLFDALMADVDTRESRLMTDEHQAYYWLKRRLPHDVIRHKSEYVRGDVHTQNIESFWALLNRGLIGTYHHVDAGYLNQYVSEYEFRHNTRHINDSERFNALLRNVSGRLDWYVGKASQAEPS